MTKLLAAGLKTLITLPSSEKMDELIEKYYQVELDKNKCKTIDGIKDVSRKEFIKVLQTTQTALKAYKDEKGDSLDEELQKQLKAAVIGFYYLRDIKPYYGSEKTKGRSVTATHMPGMLGVESVEDINKINPDDWNELFSLFSSFVKILTVDSKTEKLTNHPFATIKTKTKEDLFTVFSNKAQELKQKHHALVIKNSTQNKGIMSYFWASSKEKEQPSPSLKFVEEPSTTNETNQDPANVEDEEAAIEQQPDHVKEEENYESPVFS